MIVDTVDARSCYGTVENAEEQYSDRGADSLQHRH